jgi:soluble lytic murein transglycosylase-like protein
VEPRVKRRYRQAFDSDRQAEMRRRGAAGLNRLRQSPVRNGLIGLAVAGAAAPIAVNHYQQSLRTDASHEQVVATAAPQRVDDAAVSNAWSAMDARENQIRANMEEYSEFGVSRELAEDIYKAAMEADIDPDVAFGLVRAESSFKNSSTSYVGAVGLTQLMPKTAAWLEPGVTTEDLRDQDTNLRIGFKYLKQLIDKYDGDERLALTAYNRGPGTVDRALDRGENPDNGYANFVRTGDVGEHEL